MKSLFLAIVLSVQIGHWTTAQNVGIGNTNPAYPLDINGRTRIRGGASASASAGLWLTGFGTAANQNKAFMGMSTDSTLGLYGDVGAGWAMLMDVRSGNVGIGNGVFMTRAGLTVDKKMGATHAIFGNNTNGVAIESNFPGIGLNCYYNGSRKTMETGYSGYIGVNSFSGGMQFMVSPQSNSPDVTTSYHTAIFIKPNGMTGIGVTDPAYMLDIGERMRIRSAPGGFTAGLWLNNSTNTSSPAFIGMSNDNQVGFYGSNGGNWGLTMNTQTGAIHLNGNAGQNNQVITSNNNAASSWKGVADLITTIQADGFASMASSASELPINNATINFTVNQNTKVIAWYRSRTDVVCFLGPCPTAWTLRCYLNGILIDEFEIYAQKKQQGLGDQATQGPTVFEVPAGSHSLSFTCQRDWDLPTVNLKPTILLLGH